jgi:hypothetical protein
MLPISPTSCPFFVVSKAAGLLLLSAGVLKIAALAAQAGVELAGAFLTVVAWAEILLGLWLLLGFSARPTLWLAFVCLFIRKLGRRWKKPRAVIPPDLESVCFFKFPTFDSNCLFRSYLEAIRDRRYDSDGVNHGC